MAGPPARPARRALSGLTLLALLLAGCGGGGSSASDPDQIAKVLTDAAKAVSKGDGDKACQNLTADAQQQAVAQAGPAGAIGNVDCSSLVSRLRVFMTPEDRARIGSLQATDIRVNGTGASATLRGGTPQNMTVVPLNLQKIDGDWKISGFGQATGVPGG